MYGTDLGSNSRFVYKNSYTYTDVSTGAVALQIHRQSNNRNGYDNKKANIYVNETPTFATYKYSATDITVSTFYSSIAKIQISAGHLPL